MSKPKLPDKLFERCGEKPWWRGVAIRKSSTGYFLVLRTASLREAKEVVPDEIDGVKVDLEERKGVIVAQ